MGDSNEKFVIIHKNGDSNGDVKHVVNMNLIRTIEKYDDTMSVLVLDMDESVCLNIKETEELKSRLGFSIY